ncbi:fimbria/pilus periplasmic chaperone [Escherichia coli]|nr:fimbria/pilus periplasmic chaperone [Escherichia coli]
MSGFISTILCLYLFISCSALASGAFGPIENRLIFDGNKSFISYKISNTDNKLPWLVQSWIEDYKENRTNDFITAPLVFRVEPSSKFSVRIIKNNSLREDQETIYWVVSNAIPGGNGKKLEQEDGKINAKLSLAYRYKVPMIYRPKSLENIKQKPESLIWSVDEKQGMQVYNPSRYAVQINYISINGKRKQGDGISYLLPPLTKSGISIKAPIGTKIKYGIVNDYGAVNEYEGIVK